MSITLREFSAKLHTLSDQANSEMLMLRCANELAARMLRKVRKKTPVGAGEFEPVRTAERYARYKSGKRKGQIKLKKLRPGGNLRRNWEATPAHMQGTACVANVHNNTKYAPYVEYGHRQNVGQFVPALGKRLVKPWVKGTHMMRNSHDEMKKEAPSLLARRVSQYIRRGLNE
ncbi:Bacteriophage HK97-gp10, putative tail-component [Dialister histaminiformans]|uniref:Bacteriophage HK97-gp10, putative tail-component n=1 Tax=Allisonella histaminiformans TaxID=209880 RepID=A0A1G5VIR7_9FIRM|nr:HK97 gp10 family phage protein [Allisonella histaminiformans]SDA45654.1 Bacteriophage HK97-gp10, putative tail-component [Allisonella histaminiformans]